MDARLLVSLSGLGPRTLHRIDDVLADLDRRGVPVTLLVQPRAAEESPALTEWVKTRARGGDSVLMHGYDHAVTPTHRTMYLGRKAEFATLPAHEAGLRLTAASKLLERIELPVDGFAPPRWLASAGTLIALRRQGFALCADAAHVHDLRAGAMHRARVQVLPSGTPRSETLRCFAWILNTARAARRNGLVRLAVDASDLGRPGPRQAFFDAVDVALEEGAAPSTYGSLTTAAIRQTVRTAPSPTTFTSVPSGARLVNSP